MPSDHPSQAVADPTHNGKTVGHKLHKFLIPVPKLKPPIDPALLKHEQKRAEASQNRVADRITAFSGSMLFVYIHVIWFGVWIALNVGLIKVNHEFDKFPFGLLTMIVSLEAIFLSTFVMISQNRQAARSDLRSELDFENNIRGEIWSVHIGEALGLDVDHVEDVVRQAIDGALAAVRNVPGAPAKNTKPESTEQG